MANNQGKNTVIDFELASGQSVRMTLAYKYLLALSAKNRKAYDEYNAIWNKKEGKREELDNVRILYAAYLCASIQDGKDGEAMGFEAFLDEMPADREAVNDAMMALIAPKRRGATAMPSR